MVLINFAVVKSNMCDALISTNASLERLFAELTMKWISIIESDKWPCELPKESFFEEEIELNNWFVATKWFRRIKMQAIIYAQSASHIN